MGLFHKISRYELKQGDHIYSWRISYIYAHHGIYVGQGRVIHYTGGGWLTSASGSILSSFPNQNACPNCEGKSKGHDGVISSCLDCFLAGGTLCRYEYGVSKASFIVKRGGTCTTATADPCDDVISGAEYLLSQNGFGDYRFFKNNCEDFAIYCKTGLIVESKVKHESGGKATSGQACFAYAATKRVVVATAALPFAPLYAIGQGGKYCKDRLRYDIGRRSDVLKVPVKKLVEMLQGRLEDIKNSA